MWTVSVIDIEDTWTVSVITLHLLYLLASSPPQLKTSIPVFCPFKLTLLVYCITVYDV